MTVFKALKFEPSKCVLCLRHVLERYLIGWATSHDSIYMGLTVYAIFALSFFILIANSGKVSLYPCVVDFADFVANQSLSKFVG
jgi:hypothetical protein